MKMIGLARLGRDAEIRRAPSGDAFINLSLATSWGKKNEQTGYRETQWIDATLWGTRAETLAQYLLKNTVHCFTLDEAHIEKFTRNNGEPGEKMVARVVDVELGPRQDASGGGRDQPNVPQRQAAGGGSAPKPAPNFSDMDDDIPF